MESDYKAVAMTFGEAMMKQAGDVDTVLQGIQQASQLTQAAEAAYERGDHDAGKLLNFVESAHFELLRSMCDLTDEEAGTVEPAFTEFEAKLMRVEASCSREQQ